ncbi:MAG TPA: serine/threonine protein kinase [Burkholderiales bacterium]|nr:serine/threonine protein kinase [Burkholderiales bacterium]
MLVVSALLFALGYWTYSQVERSLRDLRAAALRSMLEAEVRTLGLWIEDHKTDMRRVAREPQVREAVEALVRIASRPGAAAQDYCNAPARRPLIAQLTALLEDEGAVVFNTVDRSQRIVASRFREYCGLRIKPAAFARDLEPVFGGETRFVRPYREHERLEAAPEKPPPQLPLDRSVVWIEAPVRSASGDIIAALGMGEYADGRFAAILAAGSTGDTGETYAFDRGGNLLSPGRYGGGVTPLARPAAQQAEGMVLEPYASYHGGDVIGAWRWVPQYDFGVAVEISAAEAYAPLRYLHIAFGVVFGALVIAVLAAAASALSVVRLRSELGGSRKLGAYVLKKRIGEGGMATVYLARHDLLRRPAAVKLLKPARATDEMIARFEREVQMASSLAHPNTVEIFDFGRTRDGLFYYAMEYLDGLTVSEVLSKQNPIPVARTIHILRQVCAALAEAHAKGVVHRDIKPENIMVCRYGGVYDHVKILDFGLVKHVAEEHSRDLTRSLRILGTPLYMAPERLRNPADVDARVDIYALGAVAFLMLTGRKLFESADDLQLTSKILNEEPPRTSAVAPQPIPVELDLLVLSCVEKRREDRPQRIADLVEALDALALEHRWTQREAELWWTKNVNLARSASAPAEH